MGRDKYPYLPITEKRYKALKDGNLSGDDRYEIRERVRHTLMNGSVIWSGLGIDKKTFETIGGPEEAGRKLDESDIEETNRLQQGLIGWLAFLYAGIEERPNLLRPAYPEYNNKRSTTGPNTYFEFELLLREAINKVENRKGRRVTDLSLEVETEPIPTSPSEGFATDELLTRFNERDPTLTGMEIAHLQREGIIDGSDWEQYNAEAYGPPQSRSGGMAGEDTDVIEDFQRESDET